ncbi:hypothetical protein [Armatimonas sp.]|uniref:hypothetical protein n=1 Tax=Armatimonas sp. TaxID=1872638 RepID=UPI0037536874
MKQEISKPLMFGVIGVLLVATLVGGILFLNRPSSGGSDQAAKDAQQKRYQQQRTGNGMAGYSGGPSQGGQGGGQGGRSMGSGYGGGQGGR